MKLTTTELILVAIFSSVINPGVTEDEADSVHPQTPSTETNPTETSPTTPSSSMNPSQPQSSTLLPLPFGEDTFDQIRGGNKLFIDKTLFIKELMKKGNPKLFVLTRPKRFGKSVCLQMVRRFLEGKEKFFDNTEIAKRGNGIEENEGWNPYPVIYIDFEDIPVYGTAIQFSKDLREALERIAASYDKLRKQKNLNVGLLIKDLKDAYDDKPVSILIDNYDLPLMDDGLSPKLRKQVTSILAKFYGQIRANVDNVRLGLAIGISKLNILSNGQARFTDLTLDEKFSSILGFTSEEVEQHLRPYFQRLAKNVGENETISKIEEARRWYGGHQFAVGQKIKKTWNPVSTCECLRKKELRDYFGNARLISIVKERMLKDKIPMRALEDFKMKKSELDKFNLREDEISFPLFMLCSGVLTIKNYNEKSNVISLGFPNDEIRGTLAQELPPEIVKEYGLKIALLEKDIDKFVRLLNDCIFLELSQSVNLPLTEFMCTRQIIPIWKATRIEFEEGEILWVADGQNSGDLDIKIMLDTAEFIISMKYNKDNAADSILALIEYIDSNEDAFRGRIREDKDIFLLGMNVVPIERNEKGNVTSAKIDQWVLLPYKDCKIWINESETSTNIAGTFVNYFKNRLRKNKINVLNSPKIIW